MYQKFKAYVNEHCMLNKQDKVIVGVSGGADSICLLFMLAELRKEMNFSLLAVHVHHGLRGDEADADEAYVKRFCKEQQIELMTFHENVKAYAKENGYTEEEAGREIRRSVFTKVMREERGTKIALAHHKNDNVETFLWNLCRGTGLTGLGGIRPVNGVWIRPLLCMKREEIESYLYKMGISYCTDETNLKDCYTRNKIRNQIIPYLEDQVNTQTVNHIAESIELLRLMSEYVENEVEKYIQSNVLRENGEWILIKEKYEEIPEIFRKNVIHELLGEIAGQKKDLENVHINMIENLFGKQVGRKCNLPYNIEAIRVYEGIRFLKTEEKEGKEKKEDIPQVQIKVFDRTPEMGTFPENPYTKWFDYDIIKRTVEIRHREPGDYIVINKQGKTQKLKQYFINEKIPQKDRDHIWLVADGQQIMWIVGYRQNQSYQITDKTTKIMEISFVGKQIDLS